MENHMSKISEISENSGDKQLSQQNSFSVNEYHKQDNFDAKIQVSLEHVNSVLETKPKDGSQAEALRPAYELRKDVMEAYIEVHDQLKDSDPSDPETYKRLELRKEVLAKAHLVTEELFSPNRMYSGNLEVSLRS